MTKIYQMFSFIVPAFNEEESITELFTRIDSMMKKEFPLLSYEIVLVDDGSTDDTWPIFLRHSKDNKNLIGLRMRKNFGKSLALMAGLNHCRGDVVVTLDADLQDNPEEVPLLFKKFSEGFDIVSGWRQLRNDTSIRKTGSKCVNVFTRYLTGLHVNDLNCGFKIMKGSLAKNLYIYGQFHRFIPLQAHLMGYKVGEEKISNSPRKYGSSKYQTFRYEGLFDLMSLLFTFKYGHSPLHFFGKISAFLIIPAILVLIYLFLHQLLYFMGFGPGYMVYNRPLISFSLTSLSTGLGVLLTGFICDFILHHHSRQHIDTSIKLALDEIYDVNKSLDR